MWFTRYTLAATNVGYGGGFLLGAPTNGPTYALMEAVAMLLVGPDGGMWLWSLPLVTAGALIIAGRLVAGATVAAATWLCFTGFNAASGAYAGPVFLLPAVLHLAVSWFVVRGRVDTPPRQ